MVRIIEKAPYFSLTLIMFTGQASLAFEAFSRIEASGDFKVKNPFLSFECSKTDLPSFLDIWNCLGASSTQ